MPKRTTPSRRRGGGYWRPSIRSADEPGGGSSMWLWRPKSLSGARTAETNPKATCTLRLVAFSGNAYAYRTSGGVGPV